MGMYSEIGKGLYKAATSEPAKKAMKKVTEVGKNLLTKDNPTKIAEDIAGKTAQAVSKNTGTGIAQAATAGAALDLATDETVAKVHGGLIEHVTKGHDYLKDLL